MKTGTAIFLAIIFVTIWVSGISIGINIGRNMNTHEYRLMLDNEETEILFETLDEIASMRVAK